jgi:prepilin-type N-terminal cleavage/methylation domain-containing protein
MGSPGFVIPHSASRIPHGAAGVTLVELLVVIGIIGVLLATGVPALTQYAGRLRLKTALRQVTGMASYARSLAISTREEHALVLDREVGRLSMLNVASGESLEKVVRLPQSVTVTLTVGGQPAADSRVVFRPTGSLAGRTATLVLADKERTYTVTITGTTGSVSIE